MHLHLCKMQCSTMFYAHTRLVHCKLCALVVCVHESTVNIQKYHEKQMRGLRTLFAENTILKIYNGNRDGDGDEEEEQKKNQKSKNTLNCIQSKKDAEYIRTVCLVSELGVCNNDVALIASEIRMLFNVLNEFLLCDSHSLFFISHVFGKIFSKSVTPPDLCCAYEFFRWIAPYKSFQCEIVRCSIPNWSFGEHLWLLSFGRIKFVAIFPDFL